MTARHIATESHPPLIVHSAGLLLDWKHVLSAYCVSRAATYMQVGDTQRQQRDD